MGDFSLAFKQINDKTDKQLNRIIKKTVFDLTSSIIQGSPTDTGRFRGNWQVSFDTPTDRELSNLDKSGNATISKIGTQINSNKIPLVYWINNNLPYGNSLEYGLYPKNSKTGKTINGFSVQAPMGFVRINVSRFNNFLKDNTKG